MFTEFLEEEGLYTPKPNISIHVQPLNSKIICWSSLGNFTDDDFNQFFQESYGDKYLIYSLSKRDIQFDSNKDKIIEFSPLDMPMYTLEFVLTFMISANNWLKLDPRNVLVVHDNFHNVVT